MKVCYVLDNIPEEELENVKDSIAVDGCHAEIEKLDNGRYRVKAVCEDK
ncbi:hypothetical protein [Aeromonas schubertii]|nr:hypothetical protein [Aeromonas schubertii]